MAKAEISWKRVTDDGVRLQVYVQHVSGDWRFFARARRFDQWQAIENPPLEDWLELLNAVQRRINRRLLRPEAEARVKKSIAERFPDAKFDTGIQGWKRPNVETDE
jgi:hypothetical protein